MKISAFLLTFLSLAQNYRREQEANMQSVKMYNTLSPCLISVEACWAQ